MEPDLAIAPDNELLFLSRLPFTLSRRVFHKPQRSGNGKALQVELRLSPRYCVTEAGTAYFDGQANKEGGCFFELVAQAGMDANGNARFAWDDEQGMLRVKLGTPDLAALLTAIREVRHLGRSVPADLQGKGGNEWAVQLFHRTPSSTTLVQYTFAETNSTLRISRSREHWRSIDLTLAEELVLERFLSLSLDAYLTTGKR